MLRALYICLQVLAALSNGSICCWDAWSGVLIHRLEGHTQQVHVLECHPVDRRVAFSAGYDGETVLWDVEQGKKIQRWVRGGLAVRLCSSRQV